MLRRAILATVLVTLTGCSLIEPAVDSTGSSTESPEVEPAPTPTTGPAVTADSPCLAGDRPFASSGIISAFGAADGDANQVSAIRWATHPGCERVVVDLLTADGAPAGEVSPVGVDYDARIGVVRINLPVAITRSAITDSRFDGALVDRVYVVSTTDGHLALDIHVRPGATIALRAYAADSPSRIVVDIKSEETAAPVVGSVRTSQAVILSPMPGPTTTTVSISGYAKGAQNELVARVYGEPERDLVIEQAIDLGGDSAFWREFHATISEIPERVLELTVGFDGLDAAEPTSVSLDATVVIAPSPPEI